MSKAPIFARTRKGFLPANVGFAHFIARRIVRGQEPGSSGFSRPIVVIAVLGIVVGMAVMILTVGITSGFQREVRAKVTGAGAHLQIAAIGQTDPKETLRIPIDQPFYPSLDTIPGVAHIQIYATSPGIIETETEIEGVVLKGIGSDYDPDFLRGHLEVGDLPAIGDSLRPIDLLLSRFLADRLRIGVDDTITVYMVRSRDDIRPRRFRICGIYRTGLEQLDHQMVFVDIAHLQRFALWGLQAEILLNDSVVDGKVKVEALAFGGDRIYTYSWPGTELQGKGPHWIALPPAGERMLTLVVSDADRTLPDTAWVRIKASASHFTPISSRGGGDLVIDHFSVERGGSGGSFSKYCGGFEVLLDQNEDVVHFDTLIYKRYLPIGLRSLSVRDRFPEIFAWLELLDKNVLVIIVLMIVVAIINMTSALLIIILERTTMIGTLKALGSTNRAIRRIFLIDAAYILGIGILAGDALGLALALFQQHFGIVKLPVETYYVDTVVIDLPWWPILLLNVGTLLVCLLALVLPSMLVTRIAPAKAIRFD